MQKNKKHYLIASNVIGLFIVLAILYFDNKQSQKVEIINKGLKSRQISGIISHASQNRGLTTLKLKNDEILYFSTTRNYNLNPKNLDEFVINGDSIFKEKNTMKIRIFRGKRVYDFELEKSLNNK
ncbi:hypothetical protein KEM09_10630 [Carboxylicivirga mesophila]|uniref:Uncharacterized protein n=1 Tax=Carboxylicivirga mesophila TaxID=1166478 RepID=A0ABS5KBZ1_9BACT|nr:hypothetical protein [Carboxylicivirga mesophila]MBS2211863.1 hypothetical protein [Carboxylicivirga mesophila]